MTKNPFVNALAVITAILLLAAWAVYAFRGAPEALNADEAVSSQSS